jgi:HK97 gp10 family phage protein
MKVKFEVKGIEEINKAISDLAEKCGTLSKEEIKDVALNTEKRSKENLIANKSVVTGTLLRSMTTDFLKGGAEAEVGTVTDYAPYVELGTRRSRAKPYLVPAFEESMQGADERIKGKLEK